MYPAVLATQGGPERTANAQVMGASGEPIPHLYAAGECGSVTARNAQSGGNLAECIVFGKIAGEEAATAKDDAVALPEGLTHGPGSGDVSVYDEAPDESGLSSGEAVGVGEGLGGPLWVKVAATGGAIDAVEVLRHTRACRSGCPCVGRAEGAHGPGWHAGRGRGGRCHGHQHGLEGSRAQRAGTWRVRDSATACEARCGMALRGGGRATRAAQAAKGEA